MKKVFLPACVIGLAVATAGNGVAATYSQDFDGFANGTTNLGDGSQMNGDASVQNDALRLSLAGATPSNASFFVPALPDSSLGWTATFDLSITDIGDGLPPADGMSLNYGNAALGTIGSGEEGMSNIPGVTDNLTFEIDTWMNFDAEQGVNIAQIVGGGETDVAFLNGPILDDGTAVAGQVTINFTPSGQVSFTTTGLLTNANFNLVPTGFVGSDTYGFILSARNGAGTETLVIDNLVIMTASPALPTVEITATDPNATEGATDTATYEITRTGGTPGDLMVDIAPVPGPNEVSPADFVLSENLTPGTITIPNGTNSVQVTLTAVDDPAAEGDELLTLAVQSNPGYTIGSNNQATATIAANDFHVTNPGDFDPLTNPTAMQREGTLRQAVENANTFGANETITFSATPFSASPQTIVVVNREIQILNSLTIDGPGANLLTLQASGPHRIFSVTNGPLTANLERMNFAMGAPTAAPGGAINVTGGFGLNLTIIECRFGDNQADEGGAISFDSAGGVLDIKDSLFTANEAFSHGGAVAFLNGLEAIIGDSTFEQNSAPNGGGIYLNGNMAGLFNSTLSRNTSFEGGGIFYESGTVQAVNCTVVENHADSLNGGGGIHFSGVIPTPPFDMDNTIVAGNTNTDAAPVPNDVQGGPFSPGSVNNLIGDAATSSNLAHGTGGNIVGNAGVGTLPLNAIVGPLADNGGPTPTHLPTPASLAINNGDNTSATTALLANDQRGMPRIVNTTVDIGSVEILIQPPVLDPIGNQMADELVPLGFTASATIPGGGAVPVFSLDNGATGQVPAGASINPNSGVFNWSPSELDGGNMFTFDVVVARDNAPTSTDRETIIVTVREVNVNPVLNPIGNQITAALSPLVFVATASDIDQPPNGLTFSLDATSQGLGMTINPISGQFNWTPTGAQAPGSFPVTVSVTDNGAPNLADSEIIMIEVTAVGGPVVSMNTLGNGTAHEPNSFSLAPPAVNPLAHFSVLRTTTVGALNVNLRLENTSLATHGVDFTVRNATSGTPLVFAGNPMVAVATIPDGELGVTFAIDAVDDFSAEVSEPINLSVTPQIGFTIGNAMASVVIPQNDYGVTSLADFDPGANPSTGGGTLRQAIINAKAGLTLPGAPAQPANIIFQNNLVGTIVLTQGPLLLDTADFSITGPVNGNVSVDANQQSRAFIAFDPLAPRTYAISGLGIQNGITPTNGGGIFNTETLTLNGCTITGCLAANGGAISNEGTLAMNGCVVTLNRAMVYGGGIDNHGGNATVSETSVTDNRAEFGGGIENTAMGMMVVEGTTVAMNTANLSGGGVDSFGAETHIINTTISGNTAGFGAGVFNEMSIVRITHATIVENVAGTSTGGVLSSSNAPAGTTTLHNSIVAGNTEGGGTPADLSTNDPSFLPVDPASSNNLIGDASSSGGLANSSNGNLVGIDGIGVRPLATILNPLANNGGPTFTHALIAGSPAIESGNNAFSVDASGAGLTSDQRGTGFLRISDTNADIGAFEVNPVIGALMVSCEVGPGPEAVITWQSTEGKCYDVLCSTDLQTWVVIATEIPAEPGDMTSYTDENPPAGRAYFKVRQSKQQPAP